MPLEAYFATLIRASMAASKCVSVYSRSVKRVRPLRSLRMRLRVLLDPASECSSCGHDEGSVKPPAVSPIRSAPRTAAPCVVARRG